MLKLFCCQGPVDWHWWFNCSSFLNCDTRPHSGGQGPFWYGRVCATLLALHAAFEDGCRWNVNYCRPRGWTRAQFKGWAGCSPTSKRWAESVPLRGPSTTEGRCLSGDTLSTPFTTCVTQPPPPEWVGVSVGAYVRICFCKDSKMKGSCPQWPCIRGYFSLCDAADSSATLLTVCLYAVPFIKQRLLQYFTSKISCWIFVFFFLTFFSRVLSPHHSPPRVSSEL